MRTLECFLGQVAGAHAFCLQGAHMAPYLSHPVAQALLQEVSFASSFDSRRFVLIFEGHSCSVGFQNLFEHLPGITSGGIFC